MADKQPNSGVPADAPGLPYYEKARQHLKELLQKRRALEKQLQSCEERIFQKETDYLENTPAGNIITGFDNYTKGTTGTASQRRKTGLTEANRVFSRSSISYNAANGGAGTSSHAPTPLQTSFKDGGLSSGPGSGQATPTSASTTKVAHGKKKKSAAAMAAAAAAGVDDSETDSHETTKKVRTSVGAVRK